MANILVVEDDRSMRLLTAARLSDTYNVITACDGLEALDIIHRGGVDLVVADVMMPRMDGFELLRTLREEGVTIPYMMLTAKETLDAKQQGYMLGTDDYMTKPFSSDELQWRIAALLRRANIAQSKRIVVGRTTIDSEKYAVYNDNSYIELPRREFDLLYRLLSYPNQIFSKEQLLDAVWGMTSESGEDTVKTHVSRLRSRLTPIEDFRISTIKGLGYKAEIVKENPPCR